MEKASASLPQPLETSFVEAAFNERQLMAALALNEGCFACHRTRKEIRMVPFKPIQDIGGVIGFTKLFKLNLRQFVVCYDAC